MSTVRSGEAPSKPHAPAEKHVIDMLKLECAIADAQGNAMLLHLALEDMGRGDVWAAFGREPQKGYHLYMLTNEQVRGIWQAKSNLERSIDEAAIEFFGRDLARWS